MTYQGREKIIYGIKKEIAEAADSTLEHVRKLSKEQFEWATKIPDDLEKKIKGILKHYADVEQLLGELSLISLLDLNLNLVKVKELTKQDMEALEKYGNDGLNRIEIQLGHVIYPFFTDYTGNQYFKLDPKKRYKFLVAFVEIKE